VGTETLARIGARSSFFRLSSINLSDTSLDIESRNQRDSLSAAVPIVHSSAGASRITDEVVAQASAILQPSQVEALRQIQSEQSAASTVSRLARSLMPSSSGSMTDVFNGLEVQLLLQ
jgi:hypothetical protein